MKGLKSFTRTTAIAIAILTVATLSLASIATAQDTVSSSFTAADGSFIETSQTVIEFKNGQIGISYTFLRIHPDGKIEIRDRDVVYSPDGELIYEGTNTNIQTPLGNNRWKIKQEVTSRYCDRDGICS